jgi:fatty-acyl-CoA synthase
VPDYVRLHAAGQPHRRACVELATGRAWTYAELDADIARCVAVMRTRGVGCGDRIAVLSRNSVWLLILQQALMRMGAIFVPLNWRLAPAEIDLLIADCDPRLLVADEACTQLAEECAGAPATLTLHELVDAIESAEPDRCESPVDPDAPSIILYTSGTSGQPKGVIITERNAFFTGSNFGVLGRVTNRSTFLCDSPNFHVIGLLTSFRPGLIQGATMLVSSGFDPATTFARLADPALGITHYFCVPQMAQMLRGAPGFDPARLRGLTALFTGGAPNPPQDIRTWLAEGIAMADGYGSTEAGTVLGMTPEPEVIAAKAGSAGLPPPTLNVRIVDATGVEVGEDIVGELQIQGPNVTSGYWQRPEETAAAFTADGWFRTGDLARRDSDGFFTLVDRLKDMFISGGENIYPAEIEQALLTHPSVAEAAVIGVPDLQWGEVGCAFVVLGAPMADPDEALAAHCAARLGRYKIPKRFVQVEALPRTGSGKLMKQELRASVHAEMGRMARDKAWGAPASGGRL